MAAGLLKLRSNGRIHVRSAGSAPGEEINPAVITAMEEVGVDPCLIYAARKIGRVVTLDNRRLLSRRVIRDWNSAWREANALQKAGRLLPERHPRRDRSSDPPPGPLPGSRDVNDLPR